MSIAPTVLTRTLSSNKTTSSTTFVVASGSDVSFTPTKPNFRVNCFNISLSNSAGDNSFVEVRFNGANGAQNAGARNTGTTPREVSCSAIFESVSVGVAHNLELYFRVNASTATILAASILVFEIIEYD